MRIEVRTTAWNDENGGSVLYELCRRCLLPAFENIIKGFADCLLQFLLDLGLYRLFCGGLLSFRLPLLPHCAVHGFHDLLWCVSIQVHTWVVIWKVLVIFIQEHSDYLSLLDSFMRALPARGINLIAAQLRI